MEIRRGDLALAALPGDYGKLRPVLVLQDDAFEAIPSVTVLPLTSDLINFPLVRIEVTPTGANGLQRPFQIMVDKIGTVRREKIGRRIGRLDAVAMRAANDALTRFVGLGET
jgi:mRNA interferase MazF